MKGRSCSSALVALGEYIGKHNVGYVFGLPLDSLAINCKKQITQERSGHFPKP